MRIGGWTRVGIVLSALWALGGYFYANNVVTKRAADMAGYYYDSCYRNAGKRPNPDYSNCSGEWDKGWKQTMESSTGEAAIIALAPIPFAWLFVWIVVAVWRWVRAGF